MNRVREIKRAQKEALLFKTISELFYTIKQDNPEFADLCINRVSLSQDKSHCKVFFYTTQGQEFFKDTIMPKLILYKPSMRKALSQRIPGRYTPEVRFAFDATFEKQQRVEQLLEDVKHQDALYHHESNEE